jgi:hypothetical protein
MGKVVKGVKPLTKEVGIWTVIVLTRGGGGGGIIPPHTVVDMGV